VVAQSIRIALAVLRKLDDPLGGCFSNRVSRFTRRATQVISNAMPMTRLASASKLKPSKYGVMGMMGAI
jgi:hypothetical protein